MADNPKYNFEEFTLEKCFTNFFIVPDYQREYVWKADQQVDRLLSDVSEAYEANADKEYFIGTTVVFNNNGQLELIDGQQRITTLFLSLCAFRRLFDERDMTHDDMDSFICNFKRTAKGLEHRYHLILQYDESSNILQLIAENKLPEADKISQSCIRLIDAYRWIYNELSKLNNGDLNRLYFYFSTKLKFIQISTPDINDALKIFETINDRGVGLNPMDLLKNLIFRQVPRDNFYIIKQKWQELMRLLENNGEKPLRFLRYFIMSNYPREDQGLNKNSTAKNIVREDEIYQWLVNNATTCDYVNKPVDFVNLLIENAKAFINFAKGRDANGDENVYVSNITILGGTVFRQHIISLLTARGFSKEMFDYLARNIECYLFYYLLTKEQAKTFEKKFADWNLILKDIKDMAQLNTFVRKYIQPEVDKKSIEFSDTFHRLSEYDVQKYRLRYVLARITQYVDLSRKGIFTASSIRPYLEKGVEIEHILPQKPFSDEIASQFENYDRSKSMLGNLTLIEKSTNDVVKNKPYAEKVREYGKSPYYLTSSLLNLDTIGNNTAINRLNQSLHSFNEWTQKSIEDRQEMLYKLALEIWKVE